MLRVNQLSGFGGKSVDLGPPSITSDDAVTVDGGEQLAFSITTNEPCTLVIGGADAALVELASNTLNFAHTLRWLSDGTQSRDTPNDADSDNVYEITVTAYDASSNASAPQSLSIEVSYNWTTAFSATLSGTGTGWQGITLKQAISGSLLSSGGAISRFTFKSGPTGRCEADPIYVGVKAASGDAYDMEASTPVPVQLFFNGSSTCVVEAGQTVTSDAVAFGLDPAKDYIVSIYFTSPTAGGGVVGTASGITGATRNSKLGVNEAATADVSGYSTVASQLIFLQKIEVASTPNLDASLYSDSDLFYVPVVNDGSSTFNASDKSANVALSGGDKVATFTSSSDGGVRGTLGKTSGKWYFEIVIGATFGGGNSGVGITIGSSNLALIGNVSDDSMITFASGNVWNDGSHPNSVGAPSPGDVICYAVDLDNNKAASRRNNGNWLGDASCNPATATNCYDIASWLGSNDAFIVATANNNGNSYTLRVSDSDFSYSKPSGFSAWG